VLLLAEVDKTADDAEKPHYDSSADQRTRAAAGVVRLRLRSRRRQCALIGPMPAWVSDDRRGRQ